MWQEFRQENLFQMGLGVGGFRLGVGFPGHGARKECQALGMLRQLWGKGSQVSVGWAMAYR